MEDLKVKKRPREDSSSEEGEVDIDSPEVKRLKENLLDSLDDECELCTASHDLDSFMKSFEEEITASPSSAAAAGVGGDVVDLTSDSGDSQPDLGYLLEASDDELGLPPTASSPGGLECELVRGESDLSEFGGEFWEMPGYDSFGFGIGESENNYSVEFGEHVALDGLFDYSDMGFGSNDSGWRPETLPAQ